MATKETRKHRERLRTKDRLRKANLTSIEREDARKKRREGAKARYWSDTRYRVERVIRGRMNQAIHGHLALKWSSSFDLLGCSIEKLCKHIESLWKPGMTWENHGRGDDKWHIDHVIPCAAFDLTDPEQQKQCFHYSNLQPLWEPENLKKRRSLYSLTSADGDQPTPNPIERSPSLHLCQPAH